MYKKMRIQFISKRILLIVLGMIFLSSFANADLREITPGKLQEAISKGIVVIDIRRVDEWKNTGVIPSSHKLTFFDASGKFDTKEWMSKFEKIVKDKNQPFILVCRSSHRSGKVGNFLDEQMGYKNVYHLKDGIMAWIAERRKTSN